MTLAIAYCSDWSLLVGRVKTPYADGVVDTARRQDGRVYW
jgi:hypothetical protein